MPAENNQSGNEYRPGKPPLPSQNPQPVAGRASQGQAYPAGPISPQIQFYAGAGFALVYALMQYLPELAAIPVLVLLPCVLYRAEERARKIAIAPLTLSTLMLTQKLFSAAVHGNRFTGVSFETNSCWPVLFVAVCLFYMPEGASWSRKLLLSLSVVVLLSGLLPGNGYAIVFSGVEYLGFLAIAGGVCLDLFTAAPPRRIAM